MKKVVTIGGGGGHSQILKALKNFPDICITGICPSTDSGGSTGILQKEYEGSGYTGDLTKCILALCTDTILIDAFSYRYKKGPLDLHSVKNLFFHALEKVSSPEKALESMWKICGLGCHRVIPVTSKKTQLHASLSQGNVIAGETAIDTVYKNPLWNAKSNFISDVYLKPQVKASNMAINAIKDADFIVICPGDLYSSIIPVMLPTGVKTSLADSKAVIILILNIMTKKGETDNYSAGDFIRKIENRLGRTVDHILYNSAVIPKKILLKYSFEQKVKLKASEKSSDKRIKSFPIAAISKSGQIYSNPKIIEKALHHIISVDNS
ncbi:MAG: YvcK family protein [Candidatus Parcubacteria bacterium]|nr:YvcK family protein [Candidatus Parcubacteria bacterium]